MQKTADHRKGMVLTYCEILIATEIGQNHLGEILHMR